MAQRAGHSKPSHHAKRRGKITSCCGRCEMYTPCSRLSTLGPHLVTLFGGGCGSSRWWNFAAGNESRSTPLPGPSLLPVCRCNVPSLRILLPQRALSCLLSDVWSQQWEKWLRQQTQQRTAGWRKYSVGPGSPLGSVDENCPHGVRL